LVTTESNDYDRSINVTYVEKGGDINNKTKSNTNGSKIGKASPQEEHHLRGRREIFTLSLLSKGER
jgi:hypothetical protein